MGSSPTVGRLWRAWLDVELTRLPPSLAPRLVLNTDTTDVVFQADPFVEVLTMGLDSGISGFPLLSSRSLFSSPFAH